MKLTDLMDKALLLTNDQGDNIAAQVPIETWRDMVAFAGALQDEMVKMKAIILEYEHALEHAAFVSDEHHPTACPDCQRLCQSALDGVNREDFREIAQEWWDDEGEPPPGGP